jgi:carboxypeptidase PM20D1
MFKRILLFLVIGLLILVGVLFFNAYNLRSKQIKPTPLAQIKLDEKGAVERFAGSIRFKTISNFNQFYNLGKPFADLHSYIDSIFPLVRQKLEKEVIAKYSLLYRWPGKNPQLKPLLLMGHLDVVPVDGGSEKDWQFEPFSGKITAEFILGRGTLDDKVSVFSELEAVETLLNQGFTPERTIYLAFGHDEEVGGKGANEIVKVLQSRKVELEMVVDEGGLINLGSVPGIKQPVALVGTAEKGYLSLEFNVKGEGGHSSNPPKNTAIGILSAALKKMEDNPMPARITGATHQMFDYIAPEMPLFYKLLFANRWLTDPLLRSQLSSSSSGNAMIRTSTAVTMVSGGVKDNVIPINAQGIVNFRILPGETIQDVINFAKKTVNDPRVEIRSIPNKEGREPSGISPIDDENFQKLQTTIAQVCPDVLIAPYLVLGGTDSRYYSPICKNIYRFTPTRFGPDDLKRFHGTNERIGVKNYLECVRFFYQLIKNFDKKS